eukprot:scaffold51839_cov20-Prasinocladus_malaysianus.AAC.1
MARWGNSDSGCPSITRLAVGAAMTTDGVRCRISGWPRDGVTCAACVSSRFQQLATCEMTGTTTG